MVLLKVRTTLETLRVGTFFVVFRGVIIKELHSRNNLQCELLHFHLNPRYLSNNFPELINLRDREGRTALHYAAAMRDNSSVYRALIQHGAETSAKDRAGNTPGQCNKDKKLLTKTMLMNFMNNVDEQPKVTNKKSKPATKKLTMPKPQPEDEKSSPDDVDMVCDVDAAELDSIDTLIAKLSINEDKLKYPESKQKFQVTLGILEIIKRR